MESMSVNKNDRITIRQWVMDRFCHSHSTLHGGRKVVAVASQSQHRRSHITVMTVNNTLLCTATLPNNVGKIMLPPSTLMKLLRINSSCLMYITFLAFRRNR